MGVTITTHIKIIDPSLYYKNIDLVSLYNLKATSKISYEIIDKILTHNIYFYRKHRTWETVRGSMCRSGHYYILSYTADKTKCIPIQQINHTCVECNKIVQSFSYSNVCYDCDLDSRPTESEEQCAYCHRVASDEYLGVQYCSRCI